jgi:sigma-B regulation protein RsbU (phosphoserine phosphatase)
LSISAFRLDSIQKKIIFYIVIITIPFFFTSLYMIDKYVGGELQESAMRRAHIVNLDILQSVEDFLRKTARSATEAAYIIKADPARYERVLPLLKKSVATIDPLFGSALALEPGKLVQKPFCRYYYKSLKGVGEKDLIPPAYDYLHADWYTQAKFSGRPMWGEPYFDKGGGEVYMSTYSHPVFDLSGNFLGVVTADIELEALARYMDAIADMEDGYIFLVSQKGFILYHPDTKVRLKETLAGYAKAHHSPSLEAAVPQILEKRFGTFDVTVDGKAYMLYTMGIPDTTWSVGVMLRRDALFAPLTGMRIRMGIITLIGMLLMLAMVLIVSRQLKSSVAKEERVRNELELASRIQQSFLPKQEAFERGPFALAGTMTPAKEVGGDFWGYRIEGEKLLFYIGDVSGKGVPASLYMMASSVLIEAAADDRFDPAFIVTRTNRKLCALGEQQMFATLLVGVVDAKEGSLTYCLAGHPPFIVKSGGRLFSPLPTFAPPVGVFEFAAYENGTMPMEKDAILVAFTDGVSEAENSKLEMFGTDRLSRAILRAGTDDPVALRDAILKKIEKFIDGNEPNDDLTMIILKMKSEK